MTHNLVYSRSPWTVFLLFLRLGLTSFGGPTAHLSYFYDEFVTRRRWLTSQNYVDLVALCQFLPGPASSQVGMAIGLFQSGYTGALAAWLGFTLPSAFVLILFALGLSYYEAEISMNVLHALRIAAVAIVAQAVWTMFRKLYVNIRWAILVTSTTCFIFYVPSALGQASIIIIAALIGLFIFNPSQKTVAETLPLSISVRAASLWLALFLALLIVLPLLATTLSNQSLSVAAAFYRTGALVFGGGHVILPLLQTEVVSSGWVSNELFLTGYGATQAVPGPLFTFAAFLGAVINQGPSGWPGGMLCLLAIFAPSFLLILGALPFWEILRRNMRIQAAFLGINAAVVGLLLAAFYQPVWISTIHNLQDLALAFFALSALVYWRLPAWLLVVGSGTIGWLFDVIL